jgi:hypothetical protein
VKLPDSIRSLLDIASEALVPIPSAVETGPLMGRLAAEIWSRKNGFYAFESALLVRPFSSHDLPLGVAEWNDPSGWKHNFDVDLSAEIFFAEDVFGEQFSLRESGVSKFNPETGEMDLFAESLDAWAEKVLENYALHTGQPLAHEWQRQHGSLQKGCRLAPKLPFVAGGEYVVSNLVSMSDVGLIEFRAQLANQIANLPEGAQIQIEISE